jgi:hypothetical protein
MSSSSVEADVFPHWSIITGVKGHGLPIEIKTLASDGHFIVDKSIPRTFSSDCSNQILRLLVRGQYVQLTIYPGGTISICTGCLLLESCSPCNQLHVVLQRVLIGRIDRKASGVTQLISPTIPTHSTSWIGGWLGVHSDWPCFVGTNAYLFK